MRILIKKDKRISSGELALLTGNYTRFIEKHTGIKPVFYVEEQSYEKTPKDGDRIEKSFLKEMTDDIYERYNEFGVDHVIVLVHYDNWVFPGIWGTNWSNVFHSYHVSLCRWDQKQANSFGTLYHEMLHSFDALIYTMIGVDVSKEMGIDWDKFIVHGGRPDKEGTTRWEWVNYKQNTEALEYVAPWLRDSYEKRRSLHEEHISLYKKLISIAQKLIVLLRKQQAIKDGVHVS